MNRVGSTGVVTFPITERGLTPVRNLISILKEICGSVYLISGGVASPVFGQDEKVNLYKVEHRKRRNRLLRIGYYILIQLKMSLTIIRLTGRVDRWIFFIGAEGLVLPLFTAKVLRKVTIILSAGSPAKVAEAEEDSFVGMLSFLRRLAYSLTDRIALYSTRLIEENGLQKYCNKVFVAPEHFIDFDSFKASIAISERREVVGYIGGLSVSKGVSNLLKGISILQAERRDIQFVIGGSGLLEEDVEKCDGVNFLGWVSRKDLPSQLNLLKLLILPSYSEGLPNIVLEAMACGTPVLVTPVGAVLDIIKDGETGFILQGNSPNCIATNIVRALKHPDLTKIGQASQQIVRERFTFQSAVARFEELLGIASIQ